MAANDLKVQYLTGKELTTYIKVQNVKKIKNNKNQKTKTSHKPHQL